MRGSVFTARGPATKPSHACFASRVMPTPALWWRPWRADVLEDAERMACRIVGPRAVVLVDIEADPKSVVLGRWLFYGITPRARFFLHSSLVRYALLGERRRMTASIVGVRNLQSHGMETFPSGHISHRVMGTSHSNRVNDRSNNSRSISRINNTSLGRRC